MYWTELVAHDGDADVEHRPLDDEAFEQVRDDRPRVCDHALKGSRIAREGRSLAGRDIGVDELSARAVEQHQVGPLLQGGLGLDVECRPVLSFDERGAGECLQEGDAAVDVAIDIVGEAVHDLQQTLLELYALGCSRAEQQDCQHQYERRGNRQTKCNEDGADSVRLFLPQ